MKKVPYLFIFTITLFFFFSFSSCTSDKVAEKEVTEETAPKVVRSRLRAEPKRINPILTTKSHELQVSNPVFPTLLNFDPETYALSPVLVKSRPEKKLLNEGPYKGGVAFTYEFLDEAVWDNGQPVLASDYLFSMKALFNPNVKANAYQGVLNPLKDITIDPDNPKRFTVFLDQAFRAESTSGFFLYPEHIYDPEGIMKNFELKDLTDPAQKKKLMENSDIIKFAEFFNKQGSIGTIIESCGAYKVAEWETGVHLILEKKKDWWGDKMADKYPLLKTYPEEIIFKNIPDDMATITAMKDGQIDVAARINPSMFMEFKESEAGKDFDFLTPNFPFFSFMCLNSKRPHLADKRVRRALAHLTDVDEIIKTVQKGMAVRYATPFPTNADYTDKTLKPIPFDIEKAKVMLSEAGWKDSDGDGILDKVIKGKKTPLIVNITIIDSEVSKNNIAILKEDAIKAGVSVGTTIVTRAKLYEDLAARNFDAFTLASAFDLDLYDPFQLWHTSSDNPSGGNRSGFGNAESDAIIEELRKTNDDVRRKELYIKLQQIIYDEQTWICLYAPLDRMILSNKFKNTKPTLRSPGYTESLFH